MSGIEILVGIFRIYRFGVHCIAFQDDKEVLILTSYIYCFTLFLYFACEGLSAHCVIRGSRTEVTARYCHCKTLRLYKRHLILILLVSFLFLILVVCWPSTWSADLSYECQK